MQHGGLPEACGGIPNLNYAKSTLYQPSGGFRSKAGLTRLIVGVCEWASL